MKIERLLLALTLACDKPPSPPPDPSGAGGGGDEGSSPPVSADEGGETPPPASGGARVPAIAEDHALFGRVEGEGFANDCKADTDCHKGGCSGEVCSADPQVVTTCDVVPIAFPPDAACGCVEGSCRWWTAAGEGASVDPTPPPMKQGDAPPPKADTCDGKTCKPGQRCIEYYGIAGKSGPKLRSCEWSCKGGCPKGTKCVTVADGPGKVCR